MGQLNFKPFPTLATDRLILRQMEVEDENELFVLRSDERVLKYIDIPKAHTVDDARKFIEKIKTGIRNNEWIFWGIGLKTDSQLIGTICYWNISQQPFRGEIGYMLHPDFQGKGIMQEALLKVIDYGFVTLQFASIEADLNPGNVPSIKLLEKTGFVYESLSNDMLIYSLKNPAYAE